MRRRTGAATRAMVAVVALALAVVGCADRDSGVSEAGSAATAPSAAPPPPPPEGCTAAGAPTTVAYEQAAGVDPNLVSIDVYGPPAGCGPRPVVFWVHGGGWSKGDKATEGTTTKAAWAAAHGWALVAVNYRLSTPGSGVVWPTHGRDVAAAVTYALDHADQFGLDPSHVALMGHSAGAHIVSFLAVAPDQLVPDGRHFPEVDCLVALDTEGYDLVERVGTGGDITDDMIAAAFGTGDATLAAASPLQALETTGGPVPDAVIVTRGVPRRQAQAAGFADALRAAGASVTVVDAAGYSHADVNQRLGTAGDTVVTPPVTTFLESCLA